LNKIKSVRCNDLWRIESKLPGTLEIWLWIFQHWGWFSKPGDPRSDFSVEINRSN
jgi:hypothetical protein